MICDYANTVLFDYMRNNGLDGLYFFLDSARCHPTSLVENTFKKLNIRLIFIPPRFTNLLQPADVCWSSSFKKAWSCQIESISDNKNHSQSNSLTSLTSWSSSRVNENFTGRIIEMNNSSSSQPIEISLLNDNISSAQTVLKRKVGRPRLTKERKEENKRRRVDSKNKNTLNN
ncbi:unnamed protein product [Brachionus calyciflorus]|uniref:DDE-1 domain-containing protein n=1 Tax=Brachionus calyciflorus TaxID=104777 RepID=A0A813X6H5_9BILA|nr:unnamed protein product [Brachionus calyciflorus]